MSVTFLTNEDKTVIDQSVETLDKKIDDLSVDDIDASGVDVNNIHPSWTRNTITSSTGLVSASATRCLSSVIPVSAGEKIIADPADLKIFPHAYDSEQNYFRLTHAWIEGVYEYVATEDLSIRFVTAFMDDSEITPEDVTVSIQTQLPHDRNLREEIGKLSQTVTDDLSMKVTLPLTDSTPDHGTAGQFAVSDGKGGITWKTLYEAEEVSY